MEKGKWFYQTAVLCLAFLLGAGLPLHAVASSASKAESTSLKEAEQEKEALEEELEAAKQAVEDLKESKGNVEEKLAALNTRLMNISERITALEGQLEEKNREISETQDELEEAKQVQAQQYEDMKLRIQFMYENSQSTYLQLLLEAKDITSLLNSVEYITEIQRYDRQKLEEYTDMVEYIAGVEEQLEQDYVELQEMKASVEEEKTAVAALMQQRETELANIADDITDAQ
ncbi:MAG: metalloendopeptidase, partial [Roseburia sp.]|nr:metalloendopeptidase [Roseburia sp.]